MRESIIQNEKKIREKENTIQSIVFTRMYERRMNIKVWKCSIIVEVLAKHTITFHTVHWYAKKWTQCKKWASKFYQLKN